MNKTTIQDAFGHPQTDIRPRPLWMWNGRPEEAKIKEIMQKSRDQSGYGGFHIIPFGRCSLTYMSEEYLDIYEVVLKEAETLGMSVCLYDEWEFPSGSAGGQMQHYYPEHCAKRLDKIETDVLGPVLYRQPVNIYQADDTPAGTIMSVVAMNNESLERIDISAYIQDGYLQWEVPEGEWKIMVFICLLDGDNLVDYLNPESVEKFIELTHEKYYERFSDYFPKVIDSVFYDEPGLYRPKGRAWTESFNREFEKHLGYSPVLLYPALWHDIGPDTAAARNALLGFRADLYANGFPKVCNDWCEAHGVKLTGHVEQEEVVNPVGITGDLMKSFKHQAMPGIDEIFFPRRARKVYKIVSSSAYNWGKSLVMSEIFGAMGENLSIRQMRSEILEQFVKGVNYMVPHGIWLDNTEENILFPPELSYRSQKFGSELMEVNTLIARLSAVMQQGYHIADVGILYPIHSLQSTYQFDSYEAYKGGPVTEFDDYQDIGEMLFSELQRDFQFLHPEVLDDCCTAENGEIHFDNGVFEGSFKVIIIPGSSVISVSNIRLLSSFYQQGGTIIATGRLPSHSTEFGEDEKIRDTISSMFNDHDHRSSGGFYHRTNHQGGHAYLVPSNEKELLRIAVAEGVPDRDLWFCGDDTNGLTYTHKRIDDNDVYLIVNAEARIRTCEIRLRGSHTVELWDPQTGKVTRPQQKISGDGHTTVYFTIGEVTGTILFGI